MPLYEYSCQSCGRRTETLQGLHDAPLVTCPDCGGALKKLISAPGIHFKGSGWYVSDYARKGGGSTPAAGSAAGEGSSETGKPTATAAKEGAPAKAAESPSKKVS